MTPRHEQTLTDLERRAMASGVPVEEIDAYIADELRVPLDHYVAYQLVWGAIESYRQVNDDQPQEVEADSPLADLETARRLRRLWEHAGAIHEAAINGGDLHGLVREQARHLIGELLVLSELLLNVDGPPLITEPSSNGAAR